MDGNSGRYAAALGTGGISHHYSSVVQLGGSLIESILQRISKNLDQLKQEQAIVRDDIAKTANGLLESDASKITEEKPVQEGVEDKPLLEFADQGTRSKILNDIAVVDKTISKANQDELTDIQIKDFSKRLNNIRKALGDGGYAKAKIDSTLENSKIFSNSPELEATQNEKTKKEKEELKVSSSEQNHQKETFDSDKNVTKEQLLVINVIKDMSGNKNIAQVKEVNITTNTSETKSESISSASFQESGVALKYQAEAYDIYRQGNTVTITSKSGETLFQFEQRPGARSAKVTVDKITSNPKHYNKFKGTSERLATLAPKLKLAQIMKDQTFQGQATHLGDLAPAGSKAIAAASLHTTNKEPVKVMLGSDGVSYRYERHSHVKENGEAVPKFTVSKQGDGISPRESIVAMSEGSEIRQANAPGDLSILKEHYSQGKAAMLENQKAMKSAQKEFKAVKLQKGGERER